MKKKIIFKIKKPKLQEILEEEENKEELDLQEEKGEILQVDERHILTEENKDILMDNGLTYEENIEREYDIRNFKKDFLKLLKEEPRKSMFEDIEIGLIYPYMTVNTKFIDKKKMLEFIYENTDNQLLRLTIDKRIFNLNVRTLERLIEISNLYKQLTKNKEYMDTGFSDEARGNISYNGSDVELYESIAFSPLHELRIEILGISKERKFGGFYPYIVKNIDMDLEDYGIYGEFNKENYTENCLIKALRVGGLSSEIIDKIILDGFVKQRYIPIASLNEITHKYQFNIILSKRDKSGKIKCFNYPNKNFNKKIKTIKIGIIQQHYFLISPTKYTKFYVENYEEIKHIKECNKIYKRDTKGGYIKSNTRFINSFNLISLLDNLKDKYLKPLMNNEKLLTSLFDDKFKDFEYEKLPEPENEIDYRKCTPYKEKTNNFEKIFYLDFETYPNEESVHIPYLCCIRDDKEKFIESSMNELGGKVFYDKNCGEKMLKYICTRNEKKILVYIHNLKYDFTFINKVYGVMVLNEIAPNGRLIYVKISYKGKIIEFKDTYALIPKKLSDFGECFKNQQEKEILPYELFNLDTITRRFLDLDEIRKCGYFYEDDRIFSKNNIKYKKRFMVWKYRGFLKNAKKWDCMIGDKIDIIKYSSIYCKIDCLVLHQGFEKFKEYISEITGLNTHNYLTISSLADAYLYKMGVYEGVYELGGSVRKYIQNCVVGGRTMTSENKKQINDSENCEIVDCDATSLYITAMVRLDGYLLGIPQIITDWEMLKNKSNHYFIRIKILGIGKPRKMSCLSKKDLKGNRLFTNDLIGNVIYIDKTGLEDAINFMDIQYKFIDGYYYDNGFNPKVKIVMKHLFNSRMKYKKLENPIQEVIKLLMNSSYGKTLMKEIDHNDLVKYDKKFIGEFNEKKDLVQYIKNKKDDMPYFLIDTIQDVYGNKIYKLFINEGLKFINYNYQSIKEIIKKENVLYIKTYKCVSSHFNRCHIGNQVLSMSKRIMNEVIYCAEDLDIMIYYQDTDSIHLNKRELPKLVGKYEADYNRNLIGKGLGEFHSDLEITNKNKGVVIKNTIYSYKSIFIGKKKYLNCLVGEDKAGKKYYDYHIRMNGIPTSSIYHYDKMEKINNPYKVYHNIYKGDTIGFDLTNGGKNKLFKYENGNVLFNEDFTRDIKIN